jgi:hypothetical protein
MKTKGKIKPSKPVSFIQMIMGGIFAIIGATVLIPQMNQTDGPVWFGALWTGMAIVGAIVGAINLFSEEGIPTEEFSYTSKPDNKPEQTSVHRSTESRLNEINKLRDNHLISEEEYKAKRSKILNDI